MRLEFSTSHSLILTNNISQENQTHNSDTRTFRYVCDYHPPPTNKQVLAMLCLGGLFFHLIGVDRKVREEQKRVREEERKAKEEEEEEGREKNDESPPRHTQLAAHLQPMPARTYTAFDLSC